MNLDPDKTYSLKIGYDERVFLEGEVYRLTEERFRRKRVVDRVPFSEALAHMIGELTTYREACTCACQDQDGEPMGESDAGPDA